MASEATNRAKANKLLAAMPNYHRWLPLADIDAALEAAGLRPLEEAIYCGREGRVTQQVGENSWLTMSWYKMPETGNYEVVAYVG